MIVPPNQTLAVIRILGSVFFVVGMFVFLVCAAQVYLGKLLKKRTATKGLYALIRHPQYVGLAVAAAGLAVMWPRLLTLALLSVMLFLYYLLAKDEERRMTNRFGDDYTLYLNRTGMFLPRAIEKFLVMKPEAPKPVTTTKAVPVLALLLVVIVGIGFVLRSYTVHQLPLKQFGDVDVILIAPDDSSTAADLVPAAVQDSLVSSKLALLPKDGGHRLLAYFMPIDYVMQGMIANTGDEWKLFEQHKTFGMITDYILHPFAHLTGGHVHQMMSGMKHGPEMYASPMMKRRIIFIDVSDADRQLKTPFDDFGINVKRTPLFFVDIHLHTAEILQVHDTPVGSGWGTVPTPMF
jgi:hypothetical protein